jgi:hypothetical protein
MGIARFLFAYYRRTNSGKFSKDLTQSKGKIAGRMPKIF